MADKKISQMTAMTSGQIANDDNIVIADTSENHTKRAEISELASFFGINPEGQRDTVGAMFNAGTHSGVTVTYDDPNDKINIVLNGNVTDAELGHLNGVTSDIQTQFTGKASLSSPALTGNPTAPTQSANDNSTKLATTQYVQSELTAYAGDTATFTNKSGAISQWTNDSGFVTPSSTSTFTNKSGSISQWTNNSGYITATSTETLNNKTISGSNNTISNIPYSAISGFVDEDISSVSGSHDTVPSAKATKTYIDAQITGINELSEATDTDITSPSAGQILVHDGSNSFDNKTVSVALTGDVTGTANMSSTGAVSVATTIPNDSITINGQSVSLGGSATIPSVLQSGGTFTGELHLNDNVKLSLGGASGSGDFELYHSSSNNKSYIKESGASNLAILGSNIEINNSSDSKNMITMNDGSSTNLFFNGSNKLATSTNGITVNGSVALSGTVDGRDVATDGTKLDGISAGAEVNVNADWNSSSGDSQILNKPSLSTVATSGSYNDLSNKPTIPTNNNQLTNGAGYITSATDNTKLPLAGGTLTGDLKFNDSIQAKFGNSEDLKIYHDGSNSYINDTGTGDLHIKGSGDVRIQGINNENLAIFGENSSVYLYHDNTLRGNTTSSGFAVTGELTCTGNMTSSNNVTAYSDIRLKKDIKTIDNALDKVSQMRGVTFTKDNAKGSGVIAQELEKIAPELVVDGEYKSVAYGNTVGYLIEAIKELKNEVEELKTKKLCKCED